MKKTAALEPTGVTDEITSAPIYVSTTCRIMYRAKNPTWQKTPNRELNKVIAKQFSDATHDKFFRPKKPAPNLIGETRISGATKFIALNFENQIWVIAIGKSSSPKIDVPAPVNFGGKGGKGGEQVDKKESGSMQVYKKAERDDWLRSHRGFLENHYFDLFQGMYAIDPAGFEIVKRRARESGNPVAYLKQLHGGGSDAVAEMIQRELHEKSEKEFKREPSAVGVSDMLAPPEVPSTSLV